MPLSTLNALPSQRNKKNLLVVSFLLAILLFPSLPGGQGGEVHVNLLVLSAFILFFLLRPERFRLSKSDSIIVFFLLALQFFLLISLVIEFFRGEGGVGSIPSAFRPLFMLFTYLGFRALFEKHSPRIILDCFFLFLIFLFSLWLLVEFIYPGFREVVNSVYFDTTRIRGFSFLTVFATTYFAGFFYFMIFMYSLSSFVFGRERRTIWFFGIVASSGMILFSQGKTSYLAAFLGLFLMLFFKVRNFSKLVVVLSFSFCLIVFFVFYDELKIFILSIDYFAMQQLYLILEHRMEFGSVSVRIEQVQFAFQLSLDNLMFGAGLGRGILLESFLATFLYRYGILGTLLYFLLFVYLASLHLKGWSLKSEEEKRFGAFFFSWILLVPVIMISSPMIEMGKNSVFSMMIVAASVSSLGHNRLFSTLDGR
jgi:hypothetical protein